MKLYVLDEDGNPVLETDMLKWSEWHAGTERHIANDLIGDVRISTVFLGVDHSLGRDPIPVLWETMIFGGEHNDWQDQYNSRDAALAGHEAALAMVRKAANRRFQ